MKLTLGAAAAVALLLSLNFHVDARIPGAAYEEVLINVQQTESGGPTQSLVAKSKILRSTGKGPKLQKNLTLEDAVYPLPAALRWFGKVNAGKENRQVSLFSGAYAKSVTEERSFPENTRTCSISCTSNFRDVLQIYTISGDTYPGAKVRFVFEYSMSAEMSKTESYAGGGGTSASIQVDLSEQTDGKFITGSTSGPPNTVKDTGQIALEVTGDLGPNGFRGGRGVYYSMSAFAASSTQRYRGTLFDAICYLELSSIQVYDSGGTFIPPFRLRFDSTTGRDYGPMFRLDPLDVSPLPFQGSISPIDQLKKDFWGAINSVLKPITSPTPKRALRASAVTLDEGSATSMAATAAEPAFLFTTKLLLGNETFSVKGTFHTDGVASFPPNHGTAFRLKRKDGTLLDLALTLDRAADPPRITGTLTDVATSKVQAEILMDLRQFTNNPKAPIFYPFVPEDMLGTYTVALPAVPEPNGGLTHDVYPEGAGVGKLVLAPGGAVRVTAKLADGTPFKAAGWIGTGGQLYLYQPLYKGRGALGGTLVFSDQLESDVAADNLFWIRPADQRSKVYPEGWPNGIALQALGSRHIVPPRSAGASVFPNLGPEVPAGNLVVTFAGAGLPDANASDVDPATPFAQAVNVSPRNAVSVAGSNDFSLKARIAAPTGLLQGTLLFPGDQRPTPFSAVIIQKSNTAWGNFPRGTRTGAVTASPPPVP